jgi:hypothetical protein
MVLVGTPAPTLVYDIVATVPSPYVKRVIRLLESRVGTPMSDVPAARTVETPPMGKFAGINGALNRTTLVNPTRYLRAFFIMRNNFIIFFFLLAVLNGKFITRSLEINKCRYVSLKHSASSDA